MPNDVEDRMFFSFNVGPAHFISINTEYYYFPHLGEDSVKHQFDWLLNDLEVCWAIIAFLFMSCYKKTLITRKGSQPKKSIVKGKKHGRNIRRKHNYVGNENNCQLFVCNVINLAIFQCYFERRNKLIR